MSPQICKSFTENVISLCFALNSRWSTTSLWYRFTTIAPFVAQYFSKSLADVTTFSTVFLIGYVVVSPLSGWAFDRIGMRWSMIAGASCNLLGGWTCYGATRMADSQVKYTGKGSGQVAAGVRSAEIDELMINDICGAVEVMLTGQTIAACGQPFFLNVPTKFAQSFFSDQQRALANSIGSLSDPLGSAAAMFLIPLLTPTFTTIPSMLLTTAIVSTLTSLSSLLMPSHPPTPPSPSAESQTRRFFPDFLLLLRNPSFHLLFFTFSILQGVFSTFLSLITDILVPYAYTPSESGIAAIVAISTGCVTGLLLTAFLPPSCYRLVLRLLPPLSPLSTLALLFAISANHGLYPAVLVLSAALGAACLGTMPVALELCAECTYPCSPAVSATVLWMGGFGAGFGLLVGMDRLRDPAGVPPDNMRTALIAMSGVLGIGCLCAWGFRGKMGRQEAERKEINVGELRE
ncbi:major facilitator superfamily domain-containing protein [Jimgerdemannia flammicorona]|uniref:Major facilitator superfamily domain-containing protein n=1 Tax=Jimgerdemannia flammicorona TaxID=994334 RepID=A0A433D4R6_9FUNG|nr:major facilitator superfamily domain-containing protein [Jimgerdemannia flammicorona]